VMAIGGNEEAARFAGIAVRRVKLLVFAISGMCAGFAGMISAGFYRSASTNTGEGYELFVVAAAVVGGASLTGGRGTALGALLGALTIKLIEHGIIIIKRLDLGFAVVPVSKEYTKIIVGVAIILAVATDRIAEYARNRRLARGSLRQE
jgi:ribose/xylose/arabinose/galactoside ABC-type transport system permease subunit